MQNIRLFLNETLKKLTSSLSLFLLSLSLPLSLLRTDLTSTGL